MERAKKKKRNQEREQSTRQTILMSFLTDKKIESKYRKIYGEKIGNYIIDYRKRVSKENRYAIDAFMAVSSVELNKYVSGEGPLSSDSDLLKIDFFLRDLTRIVWPSFMTSFLNKTNPSMNINVCPFSFDHFDENFVNTSDEDSNEFDDFPESSSDDIKQIRLKDTMYQDSVSFFIKNVTDFSEFNKVKELSLFSSKIKSNLTLLMEINDRKYPDLSDEDNPNIKYKKEKEDELLRYIEKVLRTIERIMEKYISEETLKNPNEFFSQSPLIDKIQCEASEFLKVQPNPERILIACIGATCTELLNVNKKYFDELIAGYTQEFFFYSLVMLSSKFSRDNEIPSFVYLMFYGLTMTVPHLTLMADNVYYFNNIKVDEVEPLMIATSPIRKFSSKAFNEISALDKIEDFMENDEFFNRYTSLSRLYLRSTGTFCPEYLYRDSQLLKVVEGLGYSREEASFFLGYLEAGIRSESMVNSYYRHLQKDSENKDYIDREWSFPETIAFGIESAKDDIELRELALKNDKEKFEIERNKTLKSVDKLGIALNKSEETAKSQTEKIATLENDIRYLEMQNRMLEETLFRMSEENTDITETYQKHSYPSVIGKDKRIIVLGGADNWRAEMKKKHPYLLYLSGNDIPKEDTLKGADMVLMNTISLRHASFYKLQSILRRYNIPLKFFTGKGIVKCAEEVFEMCKD